MEEFGRSLESDQRLLFCDLQVCRAHLQMLSECGAVAPEVSQRLIATIDGVVKDLNSGATRVSGDHEDIHSWVEAELRRIPEVRTLHSVSGHFDMIAVVVAPSIGELDALIDRIGALDGVERTMSSIILSTRIER